MIGNYIKTSKIFTKNSLRLEDIHTVKKGQGAATTIILSCDKKMYISGRILNDIYMHFASKVPIMRLTNLYVCIIIKNKGEFYIPNDDGYINNNYFYTISSAKTRKNYSKGIYLMKNDYRCTVQMTPKLYVVLMDPAFKRRKVELYGSDNWIEEEVNRISL